ncbi:MAG: hypothetical protein ACD_49C00067G0043 [uncultured bacterium (gcode 4)]|uniref:Guanylate cyclase domain-containing protein n=1 Tax=uncultured bacterium (gcode 4) TaxID=1234023 RepID=K2AW68_9BACT|nr:MAG: hypothetical protein ACD_49C00067G0043 [uncultured bacterium (gcode 4)]
MKILELLKRNKSFILAWTWFFLLVFLFSSRLEYIITNNFFRFNNGFVDKNIVIVALDSKTINSPKFKRFQDISRCDYAELIKNIQYWEPKAIWVDVFFSQESKDKNCDKELIKIINENENIIIWTEYIDSKNDVEKKLFGLNEEMKNIAYVDTKSYNDLDLFWISSGLDFKNKIPIYFNWNNPILPLSLALYKVNNNIENINIDENNIYIDSKKISYKNWNININFFTDNYKVLSFIDVLENNVNLEEFKDKTVLIWATAPDIHDEFLTPYNTSSFMPGVVIHANMYNSLSKNKLLNYENILIFFFVNLVLFSLFIFILIKSKRLIYWIIYSFFVLLSFILLSIISFNIGYYISISSGIILYIVANFWVYLKKYLEEKKSKDEIKSMFSKYISSDVVDELIKTWVEELKLGWFEREITVFFSDLAGFTNLSENLKPEDLWKILNVYFEEMSNIILDKKWTIDKFIGDAIMAFWNAPLENIDHATLACEAALFQRKALEKVRAKVKTLWVESLIDMRIWINTWKATIWNFWSSHRYDYTALGDTVNLASRLESINKQYGTNLIISETTFAQINKDNFIIREIDEIAVKWKEKPIKIYELIDFKTNKIDKKEQELLDNYKEALASYRAQDFKKARKIFEKIWDTPSLKFIERCDNFIKNPPEKGWDGVYRFNVK